MIERVAPIVMIIGAAVWGISVLIDAIPQIDYHPDAYVHQVMLAIVGIIALVYGVKKKNGRNGNGR